MPLRRPLLGGLALALAFFSFTFGGCSSTIDDFGGGGFAPSSSGGRVATGAQTCDGPSASKCKGACVNIASDPFNCGSCGVVCDPGQTCKANECAEAGGFAIRTVFYGDGDRSGTSSADAWKKFGRNVDGLTTATPTSAANRSCKPLDGAPASVDEDGDNGIDNSFGRNVMPLLLAILGGATPATSTASKDASFILDRGARTSIIELNSQYYEPGVSSDHAPIQVVVGEKLGSPSWEGNDIRDLVSLTDGNANMSFFSNSVIRDGIVASGDLFTLLRLFLPIGDNGAVLRLQVDHARIQMRLSPDHKTVTEGTISGFISASKLADAAVLWAQAAKPLDLCSSSPASDAAVAALRASVLQSADILSTTIKKVANPPDLLADGGVLDGGDEEDELDSGVTGPMPDTDCDAISFAIGFNASLVTIGRTRDTDVSPVSCK